MVASSGRSRSAALRQAIELQLAPAWINADPSRIEQIVTNLLTNAYKYTPPDGRIVVSVADEH